MSFDTKSAHVEHLIQEMDTMEQELISNSVKDFNILSEYFEIQQDKIKMKNLNGEQYYKCAQLLHKFSQSVYQFVAPSVKDLRTKLGKTRLKNMKYRNQVSVWWFDHKLFVLSSCKLRSNQMNRNYNERNDICVN